MLKLRTAGRLMFAIAITGLGILCLLMKEFIVGRPPAMHPSSIVLYALSGIVIACGASLLTGMQPRVAALVLGLLLVVFSVYPHIVHFWADWPNTYKSIAMVGGALVIFAAYLNRPGKALIFFASSCLASFLIASGYAHFKYAAFVDDLIPGYIPFHSFWTYACAVCLIGGGIGILIPRVARLASLLVGIMISGWFLLLHIPRFLSHTSDASDRMGVLESLAFAGVLFVLSAIHARTPGK